MRRFIVLALTLIICATLFSETIQNGFDFDRPYIEYKDGKSLINMRGLPQIGEPGEPLLPAYPVRILIPQFHNVASVTIEGDSDIMTLDMPIYPTQRQYPLSKLESMTPSFTNLRDDITSMPVFPIEKGGNQIVGTYRGYQIFTMLLYPVRYLPSENAIEYYSHLDVTIETAYDAELQDTGAFVRKDDHTMRRLQDMVMNPQSASRYIEPTHDRSRIAYDYLIITPGDLIDDFEPLAEYKNSLGIRTTIVSVEIILATAEGDDDQEKIRNYITAEYLDSGIEYVLLAGDEEDLPHRGMYVNPGYYADSDIPSDQYFFNLDGDWNDDGDNYWGEWSEIDFYGEIYGGRAAVDNSTEAGNFVNKQLMYQTDPVIEDLNNNALIGEDLGWTCWGMDFMEEVRLGCDNYGYTTVGIPEHIDVETLYDLEGIWSTTQLFNMMNSGKNLIGHLGHCSTHYNIKFYTDAVTTSNMTNNGENHNFYIIYTQGCYCNAFDNRDDNGYYYNEDAISEQWNNLANGCVCYVGNSRYGWGDSSATNGASQHLQREFYDALYGENISRISEVQADSKDDTVPFLSANTVLLWSYFESTLLGDPTLDIWTDVPADVTFDTPDVLPIGVSEFDVTVTVDDDSVNELLVAVICDDQLIGRAIVQNGVSSSIELTQPPETPGTLRLNVTGHNVLNEFTLLDVIAPDEAFIIPGDYTIVDGNNGELGWNESFEMSIPANNVGNLPAEELTATIFTECEYITIEQDEIEYGTAGAQSTVDPTTGFEMTTAMDIPVGTVADFIVTFSSGSDEWQYEISIPIQVPNLLIQNESFVELSGNGNGLPDPGDLVRITTEIVNDTDFALDSLRVKLMTDNEYVSITPEYLNFGDLGPGEMEDLEFFNITLSDQIEIPINIVFYLSIDCERGYHLGSIANLTINPFLDNFETEYYDWEHFALETGTNDQWHRSNLDNTTINGEYCWKCGATSNSGEYSDDLFTALQGPQVAVPDNSWLTFWHRMSAESSSNYPGYAYDGGFVEISTDEGDNWIQIEPEGGYPYLSRGNSSHIPEETPLYSGDFDWEQAYFDLTNYANQDAMFRFVFQSDGNTNLGGWFIDDVQIEMDMPLVPPTNLVGICQERVLTITWDSPTTPIDSYTIIRNDVVIAENVTSNSFIDDLTEVPGIQFDYYIVSVRGDEMSEYSEVYGLIFTSSGQGDVPVFVNQLWQNYPNPFNPETKIRFSVAEKADVKLRIYNVRGQLVRTLVNDKLDEGMHMIDWRGKNDSDRSVGSGVYFYKLEIGNDRFVKKMLLLK